MTRILKFQGKNENHWAWKGERAGYFSKHAWIHRNFGKATECLNRKFDMFDFKCRGISSNYEWANKSKKYKRNLKDWIQLCRSCHRLFDMTDSKLKKLRISGRKGNLVPHSGWFKKGTTPHNKTNIYKKCSQCNKKFKTIKSDFKRRKTCSLECRNLSYMKVEVRTYYNHA